MKPKNKLENDIAKAIERHHAWENKSLKRLKSANEWLFLILGLLLIIYGLFINRPIYFILGGISLMLFRLTEITRLLLK